METARNRRRPYLLALALTIATLAVACGSGSTATTIDTPNQSAPATAGPITVLNQGGSLEGHTPRGFAGSGVGLFAGDELNPNFPADDGVQIWLTFELPDRVDATGATLRSDALTVRGNPFEALGNLEVAPVRYDTFGPEVVALEPIGPSVTCPPPEGNSFTCDVSDAVAAADGFDGSRVQLRVRFEGTSDPDGEQDLALFFLSDSNTNEPGIFELVLD